MSKQKERSDIPYAIRLKMKKDAERDALKKWALNLIMRIGCVALNDVEGFGLNRLVRFTDQVKVLTEEYFKDEEIESAHLDGRMEQLGFLIEDGHLNAIEDKRTGKMIPGWEWKKKMEEQK